VAQVLIYDGANPLRSVASSHSSQPDESGRYPYVSFVDLETDRAKRIRKRRGRQLVGTVGGTIRAIHEFEHVDLVGVVTRFIFVASTAGIYSYAGGSVFNLMSLPIAPTSSNWGFLNFSNRCFAWNGADAAIVFDGAQWRIVGIAPPAAAPTYALTGVYTTGTVSVTNENGTVDGTVPAVWNSGMNGKFIDVDGIRYGISTVDVFGNGTTVPPKLTLRNNYYEATAAGLTYAIYAGVMEWAYAPFYGYTYRNPTTGHESDLSPVLEITERDRVGVTPQITIPGSPQNTAAYNAGYTEIALYRSARDGSELRRVNVTILNRNDGLAIVFTETAVTGKDTALLDTRAPQDTNREPPVGFVAMAAWLGRLFGLLVRNDIPRLYFSALAEEVPVGRGEESWPRRFSRYGVARPVGLLGVGQSGSRSGLVIQAGDGDYTIEGYDNFTFTPPFRIATHGSGGFLGGAIDVRGEMVQLYRDKQLHHAGVNIGAPVQNKLKLINDSAIGAARLHWFAYEEDDALLVSYPRTPSVTNDWTLVFDYASERISEWSFGVNAMATTHTLGGVAELAVGRGSDVFRLLKSVWADDASPAPITYAPRLRAAPVRFPTRKILRRVEIFVGPVASNPATLPWTITLRTDEEVAGTNHAFAALPGERQSAAGLAMVVEPLPAVVFKAIDWEITFPSTMTELYIERVIVVYDDAQESAEDS